MQTRAMTTVHPLFLEGDARAQAYEVYTVSGSLPVPPWIPSKPVSASDQCFAVFVCERQVNPAWLEYLGPRTVWMASVGSVQQDLALLRQALLDPLQRPGLYSLDLADYWMALGMGSQLVVHSVVVSCIREAIDKLGEGLGCPAAICLHLRMPMSAGLPEVDEAVRAIESVTGVMTNDPPLVLAAHCEDRSDVHVTLLAVYSSTEFDQQG